MSNYYCNCECGGVDPAPEIIILNTRIEKLEKALEEIAEQDCINANDCVRYAKCPIHTDPLKCLDCDKETAEKALGASDEQK